MLGTCCQQVFEYKRRYNSYYRGWKGGTVEVRIPRDIQGSGVGFTTSLRLFTNDS